jgi:hypothetical protein
VCFAFLCNLLSETFLILRRIKRDTVVNVKTSPCDVPVILIKLSVFLDRCSKKKLKYKKNFIKILLVGAKLFHADERT